MLQALTLLALTAYTVPADSSLATGLLGTAASGVASRVLAQALSWGVEWLRSLPRGSWAVRDVGLLAASLVVSVVSTGHVSGALDAPLARRWGVPWETVPVLPGLVASAPLCCSGLTPGA